MRAFAFVLPALALAQSGCGGGIALVTALFQSDDGKANPPPAEPPLPSVAEVHTRAAGPFQLLDSVPAGVAVGDFIGAEPHQDVAVLFEEGQVVVFYEGDGEGRLARHSSVSLGGNTVALAAVDLEEGGPTGLLVVTSRTLELLQWDGEGFNVSSLSLQASGDEKDLVVLDFDGDGILDVAVSSATEMWIEFFHLGSGTDPLESDEFRLPLTPNRPVSLTAADFNSDGLDDIAILAEEGPKNVLLLYLARNGGPFLTRYDAKLCLTEQGFSLLKGAHDLDGDGKPDIVYTRPDGLGTVFVRGPDGPLEQPPVPLACGAETGSWRLERFRGGGHFSPGPRGVVALQLPGGDDGTWDRATIDAEIDAVVCSYFKSGGVEIDRTISYSLPGPGRALACGKLNGDRFDDLVAVTADPHTPALAVLLANPKDGQGSLADPFYYPFSTRSGESPRLIPEVLDLAHGHAGKGKTLPFLAAVDRANREVLVAYLDSTGVFTGEEERVGGLSGRPVALSVADFHTDEDDDDDIFVISADALFFLKNGEGSGRFFLQGSWGFDDLLEADSHLPTVQRKAEFFPNVRMRSVTAELLDADNNPDLIIAVSSERKEPGKEPFDHVLVILNPSTSTPRVSFYRTLDNPRRITVANLDGDEALDLVIACDNANAVHLILGDPDHPGEFLENNRKAPWRLDGWARADEEVEDVATDNSPLALNHRPWPRTNWIVTSNNATVSMYRRSDCLEPGGGAPRFDGPFEVYRGADPESILVLDLCGDDGFLDLAILDEANGQIVFMEGIQPSGSEDCSPLWQGSTLNLQVGAPQRAVPFRSADGLKLAVVEREIHEISILSFRGDEDCSFSELATLDVAKPNLPGTPPGMSTLELDGQFIAALLVEDEEPRDGQVPVDVLDFPTLRSDTGSADAASDPKELLAIGSLKTTQSKKTFTRRFLLDEAEIPSAICVTSQGEGAGSFGFLTYAPTAREVIWRPDVEAGAKDRRSLLKMDAPLVDWEVVQGILPTRVAAASAREVRVFWVDPFVPQWATDSNGPPSPYKSIRGIASGWLASDSNPQEDLFVAILEPGRLMLERVVEGPRVPPRELLTKVKIAGLTAIGACDVNGDESFDLAVVDELTFTLHVLLASEGSWENQFSRVESVKYDASGMDNVVDLTFLQASGGDQFPDIVFGARSGEVFVFLGNGAGSFQDPGVLFAAPDLEALRAHDLDGDGQDEILAAVGMPGFIILPGRATSEP
jgi:hypothetical protein